MHVKTSKTHLGSGYLLLEVTLAIAISAIVLTTIFKIADWNLKVSNDAITSSNEHIMQSAFFSFMDRAFLELSGDARVELNSTETDSSFLSEMIIQDAGEVFSWPNQPFTTSAVKIVTKPNRDKTMDILLEYYAEPLISTNTISEEDVNSDQEPLQTLILLDDIWKFEWGVWDGQNTTREGDPAWVYEWDDRMLPRYFELKVIFFSPEEKETIHNFWNPQKINPSSHFQSFLNQSRQGNQNQPQNPPPEAGSQVEGQ